MVPRINVTQASPSLAATCLLQRPTSFSKEEQLILIKKHTGSILETVGLEDEHRKLERESKELLGDEVFKLRNTAPQLLVRTLLQAPTFFSFNQQKEIIRLYEPLIDEQLIEGWSSNQFYWPQKFQSLMIPVIAKHEPVLNSLIPTESCNDPKYFFRLLSSSSNSPSFYNLLGPTIEHAQEQFAQDRLIFFHTHASHWILLEKLYRKLSALKTTPTPADFIHLRYQQHSSLSNNEIKEIRKNGMRYNDKKGIKTEPIIFTNVHIAANDYTNNSWHFALDNRDFAGTSRIDQMLSTIFKNLNISKAYERLKKEYPQALTELKELFDAAIKGQGECGQLLVISLPEELAEQCTYSTDPEGRPNYHYLVNKKLTTTSTVALAKNHDLADFKNQHALILIEQILNPKVAQKAYVTIKSFDPVAYWRTEKYCAFEKKLDEVVELLKELETKP